MNEDIELYKHIYQDCEMSVYTLSQLLNDLKEKDNKIKKVTEEILKQYTSYFEEAKSFLIDQQQNLDKTPLISKMGASMGIKKEVKSDNSDSSIADMLIKGISMGSIDMEKKISSYKQEINKSTLKFANDFLKFQQDAITGLKRFL